MTTASARRASCCAAALLLLDRCSAPLPIARSRPDSLCRTVCVRGTCGRSSRRGRVWSGSEARSWTSARWITYGLLSGVLVPGGVGRLGDAARPRRRDLVSDDTHTDPPHRRRRKVQIPQAPPRVELVFALDTTGSMSGLIDGAKRKIWSIAQFIAHGQPKPDVRIGLVAYRDIGDAYVTRFYDLSDDLDDVFEHLSSFEAGGGGDTPEHVSKALYDAIYKTSWTKDQSALKQIYLVGDAPPHTDYSGRLRLQEDRQARPRARHPHQHHPLRQRRARPRWCGTRSRTAPAGEYASIDQSGGVRVAATPYDTDTGRAERRARRHRHRLRHAAAREVARKVGDGDRDAGTGGGRSRRLLRRARAARVGGDGDLVDDVVNGKVERGRRAKARRARYRRRCRRWTTPSARGLRQGARWTSAPRSRRRSTPSPSSATSGCKKNVADKPDSFDAKVEGALKKQAKSIGLAL